MWREVGGKPGAADRERKRERDRRGEGERRRGLGCSPLLVI